MVKVLYALSVKILNFGVDVATALYPNHQFNDVNGIDPKSLFPPFLPLVLVLYVTWFILQVI